MRSLNSSTGFVQASEERSGQCSLLFAILGRMEKDLGISFEATVSFSANTVVTEV
jgi:hypothetical protein